MRTLYKTLFKQLFCTLCLGLLGLQTANAQKAVTEAPIIGSITFQVGDTRLERNGSITPLTKGQTLKVGDRLLTGPDGHIHARMIDNGFIAVRPMAKLQIQSYTYAPQDPSANRVGLMLESGVARTISGKAGEAAREHYRFNTPVAAIGLRGTDYVVQALPDATRVSVLKGAITMSAFGPSCLLSTLSPCTGPLTRELRAGIPQAYMEVRAQGGLPTIVVPESGKDGPNKASPPRPEELHVLSERELAQTTALASEVLRTSTAQPVQPTQPIQPLPPATRPEIAWGRWSNVALPNTPTVVSLLADDREITFGNALFGLVRPSNSNAFPSTGVIGMNYQGGEAYLQTTQPGQTQTLIPAQLGNTSLQLDFNKRQFSTQLNVTAQGITHPLNAQGSIHSQGLLLVDPSRSNMNLAGVLSNNANEAGYLFDSSLSPTQNLVGATRWSR